MSFAQSLCSSNGLFDLWFAGARFKADFVLDLFSVIKVKKRVTVELQAVLE